MPLYEYQCPKCGRIEVIRKFSDPPLKKCLTCGSKLEKLLSAPAIQFKGAGWYVTDYAKKSGGSGEGSKGEGSKKAEAAGSEPAAKADSGTSSAKSSEPAAKPSAAKDKPAKKSS